MSAKKSLVKAVKQNDTPKPIDITMTNYAIDKSFIDPNSSVILDDVAEGKNKSLSPREIKDVKGRSKGTKQLLQKAQMDPNSFLHTQPIHFDNYYVQARPLAKTIFSNQYKQA